MATEDMPRVGAIVDPPKPSGLVITQMKSPKGHVMYHPVFRYADINGPADDRDINSGPVYRSTHRPRLPDGEVLSVNNGFMLLRKAPHREDALRYGFVGVCMSDTHIPDSTRRPKKRKSEVSTMAVAVAGTITMPYFLKDVAREIKLAGENAEIRPGDLVAFCVGNLDSASDSVDNDIGVLHGTEDREIGAVFVPRICKFNPDKCRIKKGATQNEFSCTAPFGICVEINPDEQQITVLLRMDLYNTHQYIY